MDDALVVVREKLQSEKSQVYVHYFSEEECDTFFRLSGDRNRRMHSSDGMRVVQGALVLMVVATCISDFVPDFGPMSIGQVVFKKPLLIGDSVCILLRVTRDGSMIKEVRVQVLRHGESIIEDVTVRLVHSSKMLL